MKMIEVPTIDGKSEHIREDRVISFLMEPCLRRPENVISETAVLEIDAGPERRFIRTNLTRDQMLDLLGGKA